MFQKGTALNAKISNWDLQRVSLDTTNSFSQVLARCAIRPAAPKQGGVPDSISCLAAGFLVLDVTDSGADRLSGHWGSPNTIHYDSLGRS